jgi:hypothetical protein
VDWAEAHHDVCVMTEDGQVLEQRRIGHSVAGIGELHALIGAHATRAVSGAKSDRGDAKVLADLVRTDRHNHRPVAGDDGLADAVRILARAHQSAIWSRQRQVNALRSALREHYPAALAAFGTDLVDRDALAVLSIAPAPDPGRALSLSTIAATGRSAIRLITAYTSEIAELEAALSEHFEQPVGHALV